MTGLLRLLAAILGRHIERDDLPPAELVWPDERPEVLVDQPLLDALAASRVTVDEAGRRLAEAGENLRPNLAVVAKSARPCWACGDPRGFYAEHAPCSNVAPFTRNPPMPWVRQSDGSLM